MRRNQRRFLNSAGGLSHVRAGTSSKNFWQKIINHAKEESAAAKDAPPSSHYRDSLKPYLNKRVQIISTKGWRIVERIGPKTRICLNDAMLIFAKTKNPQAQGKLRVPTGHMHILVDNDWIQFVDPRPNEDLLVNGVLYEYVNSHNKRNIAIMPVVVTPIEGQHKLYKK